MVLRSRVRTISISTGFISSLLRWSWIGILSPFRVVDCRERPTQGPNDVDVTLYSLKKWAGLACKGNPTALHFVFVESAVRDAIWTKSWATGRFLARTFVKPFVGFADDQLKRMTGIRDAARKGSGPEIEEEYGYDVKAAMHTLRFLYECKELLSRGRDSDASPRTGTSHSRAHRGNIQWIRLSPWRRSYLQNARRRPSRRLCRREWTGAVRAS